MGELDAGEGALRIDEAGDPLERLEMFLAPDAKVLRRNPPLGRDRRRLGEDERGSADGAGRQMREMPVIGEAIDA